MQRRQIVEAGQIVRLHEGTRERCFAPIRNGQILRHDGILSRYQVALRREGRPRSAAKWRPRHALCVFGRSASRAGVFVPRTGARRSSLGSLHRGRWPGCSSFGGVGSLRAFVLSSSNVPGWVVSQPWWLVSGVVAFRRRFESPRAYRPAPRLRGLAPPTNGGAPMTPHLPRPRPHHRAHIAAHTRPAMLHLQPISRSAPHAGTGPRGTHREI